MSNQFPDPDVYGDPEPCGCCDSCDGVAGDCKHESCSECHDCIEGSCQCGKCFHCEKSIYDCLCHCDSCKILMSACDCHRCGECLGLQGECTCHSNVSDFQCLPCKGTCRIPYSKPVKLDQPVESISPSNSNPDETPF